MSSRDNRLQPVHREGVGFISDLENKKFLWSVRQPCKDLCRGGTAEVLKHPLTLRVETCSKKFRRTEQTSAQTKDVNWEPQFEVRIAGTLNLETQVEMKALI